TRGRTHRDFYGIRPLHITLTVIFVGVVAGTWMLLGGGDTPVTTQAAVTGTTQAPAPPTITAGTGAAGASTSTAPVAPVAPVAPAVLEGEGFLVAAPHGYRLDSDDADPGMYVLTGRDPDLRIHIALDPLHGLEPHLVAEEME